MKICFLANADSIHVTRWVNAFVKEGHQVYLITLPYKKKQNIDRRVIIKELKYSGSKGYYLNFINLKKLLNVINPDILNAHYAAGYGTLSRLVKFERTLLSVWGSDVYLFPYKRKMNKRILEKNLNSAMAIASTSFAMKKQTLLFTNKKSSDIYETPFGIDIDSFKPQYNKKSRITIGTVKTMKEVYGIDYLIKSFKQIEEKNPDLKFEFLLVGDGDLTKYKNIVNDLKFKNPVVFTGRIDHKEIPNYLNKLDIYCAPSLSESFGVAVLEASACGIPVVVSNVGGLPEVVINKVTGFIVPSKSNVKLTSKINELVINKELRMKMGKEGRKFVENNYS